MLTLPQVVTVTDSVVAAAEATAKAAVMDSTTGPVPSSRLRNRESDAITLDNYDEIMDEFDDEHWPEINSHAIPPHSASLEEWANVMVTWYEATHHTTTKSTKRRGVQSKYQRNNNNKRGVSLDLPIHSCKRRKLDLAQIIHFNAQHACRTRRSRKNANARKPKSWRETVIRETEIVVSGDFRNGGKRASYHQQSQHLNLPKDYCIPSNLWNAILAIASETASDTTSNRSLSELWEFVFHVALLPGKGDDEGPMEDLVAKLSTARKLRSKLLDSLGSIVDLDVLAKLIDATKAFTDINIDELPETEKQFALVKSWQTRVDEILARETCVLEELEELLRESKTHTFQSKGRVVLEAKLGKAYCLESKIIEWSTRIQNQTLSSPAEEKESIKFVASLFREIQRLKITSRRISDFSSFYESLERWIERANVGIRSRLSLDEIQDLLLQGRSSVVDLSDYLEKLQSRVDAGNQWLDKFAQILSEHKCCSNLEVARQIRAKLEESTNYYSVFHELATEGSRIPVEVDRVKLLQIEMDARNWMINAKKWLPPGGKRGKLDELSEHAEKGNVIRDRFLVLDGSPENSSWVLEGEVELFQIVKDAQIWLSSNQELLESDRRSDSVRRCLSVFELRTIVQKGNEIHANLGPGLVKLSKILSQADSWFETNRNLLIRCRLITDEYNSMPNSLASKPVSLEDIQTAVHSAASEISWLDLKEALKLQELASSIEKWFYRAEIAAGYKRQTRGKKLSFSIVDILSLISEATSLPVPTDDVVARLQHQLILIKQWQESAVKDIEAILNGFRRLRVAINETYGMPSEYKRDLLGMESKEMSWDNDEVATEDFAVDSEEKKSSACDVDRDDGSGATMESDDDSLLPGLESECNIQSLIKNFSQDTRTTSIITPEQETALKLDSIARWCMKSVKYLENQREIFDKRFFGAFDRFISEGEELLLISTPIFVTTKDPTAVNTQHSRELLHQLHLEWSEIVSDQLVRLRLLLSDRQEYIYWSNQTELTLSSTDRRPSLEKLKELAEKSREFPGSSDLIQKTRKLAKDANAWAKIARSALYSESDSQSEKRMTMHEAKLLLDRGERLRFSCDEIKMLRTGLREARSWATRAKKCKVDDGCSSIQKKQIEDLLEEHEKLVVDMGDEALRLRKALKSYCICRRPYEGFMIGCDECDEWFHGFCVGVSESRADKVNKYVCIRCLLKLSYQASSMEVVDIIRKWTSLKELRKARHQDDQKFKRKIRKENKEMEKLEKEASELRSLLKDSLRTTLAHNSNVVCSGAKECVKIPPPEANISQQSGAIVEANSLVVEEAMARTENTAPCNAVLDPALGMRAASSCTHQNDVSSEYNPSGTDGSLVTQSIRSHALSKNEILLKLERISQLMHNCTQRLSVLSEQSIEQKRIQDFEDAKAAFLRHWCIRVRSLVLIPSTMKFANSSRPNRDGSLSVPMLSAVKEAKHSGLHDIADIKNVSNAFNCISWSLRAMWTFTRQPSSVELRSLVKDASDFQFTDERGVRAIRSLSSRAKAWEIKVAKALQPIPGESKPFDVAHLQELAAAGDDIPVVMPCELRIATVIEDNGCRHCLCGGPSDGRFMLCCETCDRWFHGHCVRIQKNTPEDELTDWKCPSCCGEPLNLSKLDLSRFHRRFSSEIESECKADETDDPEEPYEAPASNPNDLWPPFGLLGSAKAREVLGEECSAITDRIGSWCDEAPSTSFHHLSLSQFLEEKHRKDSIHSGTASIGYAGEPPVIPVSSSETDVASLDAIDSEPQADLQTSSISFSCKDPPTVTSQDSPSRLISSEVSRIVAGIAARQSVPMEVSQVQASLLFPGVPRPSPVCTTLGYPSTELYGIDDALNLPVICHQLEPFQEDPASIDVLSRQD